MSFTGPRKRAGRARPGFRLLRRLVRDESGVILIEFALAIPIFLFVLIGTMELAYAFSVRNSVALAARDGARYAIVNGAESSTPADSAMVANYVAGRVSLDPLAVTTTWPTDNRPGSVLRVTVEYDFRPLSSIGLLPSRTISSTSEMVISY